MVGEEVCAPLLKSQLKKAVDQHIRENWEHSDSELVSDYANSWYLRVQDRTSTARCAFT